MSILTPEERRLYADPDWRGCADDLTRLWEAYVAMEERERHRGNDLLACHEIIAGAWEALGNLVPKDGEGTLGEEVAKALKAAQSAALCRWTYDDTDDAWDTACGEEFLFSDGGGPESNRMRFCHGCGRPVSAEAPPT